MNTSIDLITYACRSSRYEISNAIGIKRNVQDGLKV